MRDRRSVRRDLVMLDALRGADDGRVAHAALIAVARVVVAFADQSLHARAGFGLRVLSQSRERLLEPRNVLPRFVEMLVERIDEIAVR
jgi:hypothetical protein